MITFEKIGQTLSCKGHLPQGVFTYTRVGDVVEIQSLAGETAFKIINKLNKVLDQLTEDNVYYSGEFELGKFNKTSIKSIVKSVKGNKTLLNANTWDKVQSFKEIMREQMESTLNK